MGIALALLTALMVWGGVKPSEALDVLRELEPAVFFMALGSHMSIYCFRALRFMLLVPKENRPPFGRALMVTAAHNLASYVLPAKTGEATLVVYLRTQAGVPAAQGLASLVVSRLLDGAILCAGLSAACLYLSRNERYSNLEPLAPLGAALLVLCFVFLLLSLRSEFLVSAFEFVFRSLRLHRFQRGQKLLEKTERITAALREAGGGGHLVAAALATIPIWGGVFFFYAVLSRSMGLPEEISYAEATFGSSLAVMFNLLPVNGFAGFGTQEMGWSLGFGLLGVEEDLALATGIGCHFVQLFNVCAMGLIAHFAMGLVKPLQRDVPSEELSG